MACPWAPCPDCARGIIQAGLVGLLTHRQAYDRSPAFWLESIAPALEMLDEAGVWVRFYDGQVSDLPVRHSGEVWVP
jgi:deoxycytidylate deaminase